VSKAEQEAAMGATKVMEIRHSEKPGLYGGKAYYGVDECGTVSGAAGGKHLVSLGWERASSATSKGWRTAFMAETDH
jgi:hypothetical protein